MYNCEICGREIFKKNRIGGYTVCSKHMHQYYKYGKFLDNIPRTNKDLNEFRYINDKIIEFDVYYQNNTVCDSFIIDREDLNKIRYKKWRKDSNNHIITGNNVVGFATSFNSSACKHPSLVVSPKLKFLISGFFHSFLIFSSP